MQIVLKVENEKKIVYTVWQSISIKKDFNVVKTFDGKTFGMVGTQNDIKSFAEMHQEVINMITKEYPEARRGIAKFCKIEVVK